MDNKIASILFVSMVLLSFMVRFDKIIWVWKEENLMNFKPALRLSIKTNFLVNS